MTPNVLLNACRLFWDAASLQEGQRRDFIKLFGQAGPPSSCLPVSTCHNLYTIQPLLAAEAISAAVCMPSIKACGSRAQLGAAFRCTIQKAAWSDFRSEKLASPSRNDQFDAFSGAR